MVTATGIRILSTVDYERQRGSVFVVAISVGVGMIPLVSPTLFKAAPEALHTLLDSGILLASITAVVLNAFFNSNDLVDAGHAGQVISDHV